MKNFDTFYVILRIEFIVRYFLNQKLLCEWLQIHALRLLHSSIRKLLNCVENKSKIYEFMITIFAISIYIL